MLLHNVCFNPRLHVGGDHVDIDKIPSFFLVSIHASTWEATPYPFKRLFSKCFNPRFDVGGDIVDDHNLSISKSFNPRLHVGGDPQAP